MDASQAEREARLLREGREELLKRIMMAEKKGKVGQLPYQNYLIRQVLGQVAKDVKEDAARKGPRTAPKAYKKFALYMGSMDPEIVALRAIQAVLEVLLRTGGGDVAQPVHQKAAQAAGKAVYGEYLMRNFKKLSPPLFNSLQREYDKAMTRDEKHLLSAFKAKFAKEGYTFPVWAFGDIELVGMYLVGRLIAHGFLESWTRTERKNGKAHAVRYLRLSEHLRSGSLEIMDVVANAPRVAGPLIEPPKDWDSRTNTGGGYHTPEMQRLMPYAVQGNGPKAVADLPVRALNILQRTAWRVNTNALGVVQKMALKRSFGDVVSPEMEPLPDFPENPTEQQKKEWKATARQWYTDKKTRAVHYRKSLRAIGEARDLQSYTAVWFAYYADFRGRAYARSTSLSPQGNDLEKGLIEFAVGQPLSTPESVYWFKANGANKYGLDKVPLAERQGWVDAQHEFLVEMGADPLAHPEWTEADSPVQFLAWVMEYSQWAADPIGFRSHLPLGQDGTCNGLQNFSALMCDPVGGAAVNLVPSDAPRDIYADVAVRVTELLREAEADVHRDSWLAHGMNRKITKRTTMTLPYGCTRYACSTFITEDYLEKYKPKEILPENYGASANYLSHKVWDALDDVVVKAREVMEWLKGWAKHAASTGRRVSWRAPSGLEVTSEYERVKTRRLKSVAFKTAIMLYEPEEGKPDLMKVANAVAPNFVHSLDASHMARVMDRAAAEGMTPTSTHDDFGVHAVHTTRLHEIIREEFVAMYKDRDILGELAASTGYEIPPPEPGDLDLNVILKSPYFFH